MELLFPLLSCFQNELKWEWSWHSTEMTTVSSSQENFLYAGFASLFWTVFLSNILGGEQCFVMLKPWSFDFLFNIRWLGFPHFFIIFFFRIKEWILIVVTWKNIQPFLHFNYDQNFTVLIEKERLVTSCTIYYWEKLFHVEHVHLALICTQ